MLDYSIKMIFLYILLRFCTVSNVPYVYTNDKIFEIPGFRKVICQNKLVLIEKYIDFVDISELGESYNRSSKIHPIHKYIIGQSLLTLGCDVSIGEASL